MHQPDCFSGPERLETFPPLGREMRMGAGEALAVSDRQRLVEAIARGDRPGTLAYLRYLHAGHRAMLAMLWEWALQYPASLAALYPDTDREVLVRRAYDEFRHQIHGLDAPGIAASSVAVLDRALCPGNTGPGAADAFRQRLAEGPSSALPALAASLHEVLEAAVEREQWTQAGQAVAAYWNGCRILHDGLVAFTSAFPTQVLRQLGQEAALELVRHSFSNCSFFDGLWQLGRMLCARELAAFLAEHLRFHFSGADRGGACRVVEEVDRYRIELTPCGSGGALRRRHPALDRLPLAAPATWNRSGEVPLYCAHCAFNELASVRLLDYPVLVTEFDPDPARPCGWTVYKSVDAIPEACFTRIGVPRPG